MPWRELANDYSIVNALEKKAPGGFGLGSAYTDYIADFNACIKNGWYRAYSNSLNSPSIGGWNARYGALLVSTRDSVIYHVYYVDRYSVMYTLERYSNDGGTTWSEWEYVNPPLQIGVEYRTTERYQEKPVYYKIVDCGQIVDNKQVEHGVANMRDCIFCQGLRSAMPMPSISNNDLSDPWSYYVADVNRTKITLACGTTAAGGNCHVILKYTKTTD